jgi:hypothetical protein
MGLYAKDSKRTSRWPLWFRSSVRALRRPDGTVGENGFADSHDLVVLKGLQGDSLRPIARLAAAIEAGERDRKAPLAV